MGVWNDMGCNDVDIGPSPPSEVESLRDKVQQLTAQVEALTIDLAIARHSREVPISATVDQVRRETFEATREACIVLIKEQVNDFPNNGAWLDSPANVLRDIRALKLSDITGGGDHGRR